VGEGEKDVGQFDSAKETDFVTGCAMLMRTRVLRQIGPLDERFFLTHEDVDWCYRARSAGYSCQFVPAARVWHKVSASFARSRVGLGIYFTARNRLLWAEMHLGLMQRLRVYGEAGLELLFPGLLSHRRSTAPLIKKLYWLMLDGVKSNLEGFSDPSYRAWRYGATDYVRRRFGDCPADIRRSLMKDAEAFLASDKRGR
jgi:GT2 family glycosyltransferase